MRSSHQHARARTSGSLFSASTREHRPLRPPHPPGRIFYVRNHSGASAPSACASEDSIFLRSSSTLSSASRGRGYSADERGCSSSRGAARGPSTLCLNSQCSYRPTRPLFGSCCTPSVSVSSSRSILFDSRALFSSASSACAAAAEPASALGSSADGGNVVKISNTFAAQQPDININDLRVGKLRNFGISAHIDSGKTTLTERILYYTGKIKEIHDVRGKTGVGAKMDHMALEREKGITICSAATFCSWKNDHEFNIIDTPGHVDFTIEVERALRVLDGAVMICCAVGGVQAQTLTVHRQMARYEVPRLIFINKMDRFGADPFFVQRQIRAKLGLTTAAVQLPYGEEDKFAGVVDVIENRIVLFEGDQGQKVVYQDLELSADAELKKRAQEVRTELVETLADLDDDVALKYLEEGADAFSAGELQEKIREYTLSRQFCPLFMGSAYKNRGVQELLDGVALYLPSPLDRENKAIAFSSSSSSTSSSAGAATSSAANLTPTVRLHTTEPEKHPLVCYGFKIQDHPTAGVLTYVRVYQGKLKKGMSVYDHHAKKTKQVKKLVRMHSLEYREVDSALPGDIVAVPGLDCSSGTTFTDTAKTQLLCAKMHVPEPVMSLGVKSMNHDDTAKFFKAVQRFKREDPTFHLDMDPETKEHIMRGMGELHLEIYLERMKREFKCVQIETGSPMVSYKECIGQKANFEFTHKRQTGGRGQYGKIAGFVEPIPENELPEKTVDENGNTVNYVEFVNQLSGNDVPKQYHSSIEKGFRDAVSQGFLSGNPLINLRFVVTDGKAHENDSSDIAFQLAAKGAVEAGLEKASPQILEPLMNVEVSAPTETQAAVVQSMSNREGSVQNTVAVGTDSILIEAIVPLRQMFGYAKELRSLTQGVGEFSMDFREYVAMPTHEQNKIIRAHEEATNRKESRAGKTGADG
ncbi:unnamed protein product [Amoebophrya sp. A120]|nr:unnamed protein product [Amoebophrya sp. A120]|eukprot:GSA120T00023006001.1